MDIKAYISSGKLEAYWMGELSNEEMLEVDLMADQYPLIKQELEAIKNTVNKYAAISAQNPSNHLLEKVMSATEEHQASASSLAAEEIAPSLPEKNSTKMYWTVAASILLAVSIGINVLFYSKWQNSEQQLVALNQEVAVLANRVMTTNQQLDDASLRVAHFLNKDNIHVRMDGLDLSPNSFANVFWNRKTNGVFISVDNLPEPPHGHQYQLWAIKAGQPPIDAGIFEHHQRIQELKTIKGDVIAFAVTLEKEGGTQNATVENTYVKGLLKKI